MIQKQRAGKTFAGVVRYVLRERPGDDPREARVLDTNLTGEHTREMTREFDAVAAGNARVQKPVWHCSLRLAPEDPVQPDERLVTIGRQYLEGMGFHDTPYLIVRHGEDHVHLVASRVRLDGTCVDKSWDYYRSNTLVHALEREHGLEHAREHRRGQGHGHGWERTRERERAGDDDDERRW